MDAMEAIKLLRERQDEQSNRIADVICMLTAALGQAALTAGRRVADVYETSGDAVRRQWSDPR